MNLKTGFLALLAGSLLFVSCSKDDDAGSLPAGDYENGIFVLNEGNSNPSTGTVSFIGADGITTEQDIYTLVNPDGPAPGSWLQSMFFSDDMAFIISGQANKVTVVNRFTFQYITTIEGFRNPRYGAAIGNKAYITNADNFAEDDNYLTVIDLTDFSTSTVPLNNYSDKILEDEGKLYLLNGYGIGTTITVFNPSNNTIEADIELGDSPNSFDEEDGAMYVLGERKISRINLSSNMVSGTIELTEPLEGAGNLTIEDDNIYFTWGASVYTMPVNTTALPSSPLLTYESDSQWGVMYGFNVKDGKIYIADGGDFASDSKVYVYTTAGAAFATYTVGVGPNSFYFN